MDGHSSHLRELVSAGPEFREGLRAIYVGSDEVDNEISITEGTLRSCFEAHAWPNLEHVRFLGSAGAFGGFTNAIIALVLYPSIQSIILTPKEVDFWSGISIYPFMGRGSNTLKYLELINMHVDDSIEPYLPALTKKIQGLEFLYGGYEKSPVLWRDGKRVW